LDFEEDINQVIISLESRRELASNAGATYVTAYMHADRGGDLAISVYGYRPLTEEEKEKSASQEKKFRELRITALKKELKSLEEVKTK
jgi:hypothetical protein